MHIIDCIRNLRFYSLNDYKIVSIGCILQIVSVSIVFYCSCTVVLFNPRKNSQAHVLNACRKTVTSLALAGDGKLLATGECGHMPNVRVWDISDPHNAVQIAEFAGHKYGINCVVSATRNISLDIFFIGYFYWLQYIQKVKYSRSCEGDLKIKL